VLVYFANIGPFPLAVPNGNPLSGTIESGGGSYSESGFDDSYYDYSDDYTYVQDSGDGCLGPSTLDNRRSGDANPTPCWKSGVEMTLSVGFIDRTTLLFFENRE
jgi:hypothetical protein